MLNSGSSKNCVQALVALLDQFLGGRDDFIGQEFEQVILTGEADRFECTLFYEEIAEHGPVRAFLLKDRDKEDPPAKAQAHRHQTDLE